MTTMTGILIASVVKESFDDLQMHPGFVIVSITTCSACISVSCLPSVVRAVHSGEGFQERVDSANSKKLWEQLAEEHSPERLREPLLEFFARRIIRLCPMALATCFSQKMTKAWAVK